MQESNDKQFSQLKGMPKDNCFIEDGGFQLVDLIMTVQRGNAISVMGTLGPLRKLEDFFEIISPREERS